MSLQVVFSQDLLKLISTLTKLQLYKVKVGGGGRVQLEPDEIYDGGGSCLEELLAGLLPYLNYL